MAGRAWHAPTPRRLLRFTRSWCRRAGSMRRAASPFAIAVALPFSWSRDPRALPFFALADPADFDERAHEWHVRAALWAGDWARAAKAIYAMPEALRNQNRWRYWSGRAAERLGNGECGARASYTAVLPTDNWYAALAAARLGQPFAPTFKPAGVSDAGMDRLAAEAPFVRARELALCDMQPEAIAEWRAGYDALEPAAQIQAIGLAARWAWYLQAISAAAKLGVFDDYDLLYPHPYDAEVRRGSSMSRLPPDLIYAIIRQESLYRADARSSADAIGLMQLLPETARRTAKSRGLPAPSNASLVIPSVNVPLGSAYLRSMLDRWDGQAPFAIASYNAGPGAVKRWLPEAPMATDVWVENIPYNETRTYVQRVSWHRVVFGWIDDRKPRDFSAWLGTVQRPAGRRTAGDGRGRRRRPGVLIDRAQQFGPFPQELPRRSVAHRDRPVGDTTVTSSLVQASDRNGGSRALMRGSPCCEQGREHRASIERKSAPDPFDRIVDRRSSRGGPIAPRRPRMRDVAANTTSSSGSPRTNGSNASTGRCPSRTRLQDSLAWCRRWCTGLAGRRCQ